MLRRYQVLLADWLGDHFKEISKKYDISFSEAIRIVACLQVPKLAKIAHPKCKFISFDKELVKAIKQASTNRSNSADFHKLLSEIYFEARKALEVWDKEEKKINKAHLKTKEQSRQHGKGKKKRNKLVY